MVYTANLDYLPITLTILEKRDNVALRNGWKNLPTTFHEITVEIA